MRITRWGEGVRAVGRGFYVWDEDERELRDWAGELYETEGSRVRLDERRESVVRPPLGDRGRRGPQAGPVVLSQGPQIPDRD